MRPPRAAVALVCATVAVSFSAIFIRIAADDAATIVWLRMALAAILLAPLALHDQRRGLAPHTRRQLITVTWAGTLLAGHFLLWTASLAFTSVAASVLLVSLHPVLVAPLSRRMLDERIDMRTYIGMGIALAGTVITCAGDLRTDPRALLGDVLALGGAACLAGYLVIGRGMRRSLGVAAYSALLYTTVAAVAGLVALGARTAHVPSLRVLLLCLALAVVCTLGGHTVYNWALRQVNAVTVSVAFLGEPPLTAMLALLILGTAPSLSTLLGGALILVGLACAISSAGSRASSDPLVAFEQP